MNPHVSSGTKDFYAAQLVLEPMMNYLPDGTVIPNLVEQVPTVENGLLKEDLTGFTATIKEGIVWSDGTPLTAADVVFTWQWIIDADERLGQLAICEPIQDITAVDERTFTVTLRHAATSTGTPRSPGPPTATSCPSTSSSRAPRRPRTSTAGGLIGTGPYMVTSFAAERPGHLRGQPELPRAEQALLRRPSTSRAAATRPRRRGPSSRPATGTTPGTSRSSPPSSTSSRSPARTAPSSPRRAPTPSGSTSTSPTRTRSTRASARTRTCPTRSSPTWRSARRWPGGRPRDDLGPVLRRGRAGHGQHRQRPAGLRLPQHELRVQPRQGEGDAGGRRLGPWTATPARRTGSS